MADESLVKTDGVSIESLLQSGITSKADIAVMEKLFTMRNTLKAEKDKEAFYRALANFQSETSAVPKSKPVKYNTQSSGTVDYHYAPIESIVESVKGALEKNGFSYTLKTEQTDTKITVTCEAHHESGHTESTSLTVPMSTGTKMNAIQQIGSAITYAKRYAFCNAFGIMTADEDTDCIEAEIVKPETKQETQKPPLAPLSDADKAIYDEYYLMLDTAEKETMKKEFNIITKQDYYDKVPFESIKIQLKMKKEVLAKMAEDKK